ncbi:hypothetical protein RD110_16060 [Rhodoferax koreense]|uniref:Uncharacterized protein n=1 Tax=Rhodoferax koreensis TaxID=1842727 RepID=A0A1P8JXQ8_9BURK|nr:hypothetical protein [Rhodoferax koreense]APW38528.1 hypothetical protein RD110_16060 [Rhodoferax koreense]
MDLLVDVRLDQADDAVGQCFDAEVFHADSRVDGNRVQVTVQNVTPALGAVVRIRSSAIVDEPVLSVTLRSTCGQTASRRYDFLTDFPVETRSSAVPTVIPSAVTTGSSSAAPVPQDAPAGIASAPGASAAPAPAPIRVAPAPVPRAVVAPRPPRPAAAVATRPPAAAPVRAREQQQTARTAQASASEAAQSRPRLRLDAATVAEDRLVPLKSSSELLSAPTDNAQQRAEATAAWRSLNQLPAENPQDEKDRLRLQALEAEGKALKAQLAKNEEDFRLRLERLEANRYDSNIVYLLLALLFAALLAAAFFWNRARKSVALVADWSRQNDPQVAAADAAALAVQAGTVNSRQAPLEPEYTAATRNPTRPAPLAPAVPAAKVADPEIDESLFQDLKKLNTITLPQVRPAASASLGAPAAGHAARGLSPEDFFDVQQHADFFVSLGQYDQAIDVLKKNIDENIEVSPLAYLELLKIYHTLSRQDDYNHLRDDFNRIFNGNVPPFASFNDEGRGLEDYPSALLAIENNWGTPQVLDVIESNLYRAPGASSGPAYDLAAYREFLLLYAIAKTMVRRSGTSSVDIPLGRVTREAPLAATAPAVPLNAADATNAALAASMVAHPPVSRPPPPSFENSLSALLLDEPVSPEPSVGDSPTQPMLLMADTSMPPVQPASGVDIPSYKQPLDLDLDLDLNLDFSNSELQVMGHSHDVSAPPLPMLDLPESFPPSPPAGSPAPADVPPGFPPSTGLDSNLIEFDLFDPSIEAKISPKSK